MHGKLPTYTALALILAAAGGGCSGLSLPKIDEAGGEAAKPPQHGLQSVAIPATHVVGTSTEVYTRIARGVLTCWFGADGPLKQSYIYHAQADPASKGGKSRIRIMTRDHEAEDPRALRAYMIKITPGSGMTRLEVENRKLPAHLAEALQRDVSRWAGGDDGCGETPVTAGWSPDPEGKPPKERKDKGKRGGP